MQELLIVVDMQNDFIDGALGTAEAVAIVEKVREKILGFPGRILFTRDTHEENYMDTQEGRKLPVPHCIRGTKGWEITDALADLVTDAPIDKPTFGSAALGALLLVNTFIFLFNLCTFLIKNRLLSLIRINKKKRKRRMAVWGTVLAISIAATFVYTNMTLRSLIMNSSISLELYRWDENTLYTIFVYISYTSPSAEKSSAPASKASIIT